jgi:hypothetical protein
MVGLLPPPLPLVSSALSASVTTRVAHAASVVPYTAATPPAKSNLTYFHGYDNDDQVPL